MPFENISLTRALDLRSSLDEDVIVIVSVDPCLPCDMLRQAIADSDSSKSYLVAKFSADDKKAMGTCLKAGINTFPHTEMIKGGMTVAVERGVATMDPAELQQRLRAKGII